MSQPAGRTLRFAVQFWGQHDSIHNLQFSGLKEPDMRATGVRLYVKFFCLCAYKSTHTHTHTQTHTCTHAHMHTCTHAHMHTCTHTHMHKHIHIYKKNERKTNRQCMLFSFFFICRHFAERGNTKGESHIT